MPDWRYNVLSTSEAYIDTDSVPTRDPLAASYPRRADRTRPPHTCPYTTIFHGGRSHQAQYRLPHLQSDSGDPYADVYSVDRSSNLTDTSSFAHYEDCRTHLTDVLPEDDGLYSGNRLDNVTLQVQKVPYTSSVFYISTKNEATNNDAIQNNNAFVVEGSDSDALSSCTCDSFERCEFDCRDFEPFSDTCCCDPLSDGVCSRSPKDVDSPEHFCDRVAEEDGVSTRSDMDGLDLTLFEPAQTKSNEYDSGSANGTSIATSLCGILHTVPDSNDVATSAVGGALVGVPLSWEPFYCVLQQDRQILTAYTSEELAVNNNNGEYSTRSLPRVRLDTGPPTGNAGVRLRCWAAPPSITEEEVEDEVEEDAVSLRAIPAQDTSYEKACRRGSAPSTPVPGAQPQHSPSRLASFFFSKRSFRSNPLKRTKSGSKLEGDRTLAAVPSHPPTHALRTSRSHESLLSAHSPAVSTMDLGPPHQVEIRSLHSSVLGRPHCFALSAENRAARYFACASRKERDRWIYSLRQAARPDEMRTRRCERTVKLWLLEAKAIPPKKRYYCEILLDDTLYARSSSKLKTELCFWGEVYEFSGLPAVRAIHVNVYREPERRSRKRDKHALVGTVRIPVDDVSSRYLNERWYPVTENDKPQSPGGRAPPAPAPALRIKCRYQCVDVLPLDCYARFLDYLKRNYRRLCEFLEPVIGVKAKEDIGCALVLCMAGAGLAPRYLADVVALDVRRTGDHSLTFRGNSLATKSMEAYLKLVGDQYLQDTLGEAVCAAAGTAAAECEVDPLRAGSGAALRRHQAALRDAVTLAWRSIAASAPHFPPPLRDCFATFRERLTSMGREDISDNLISASIFLRFLCPAILSPSLFGITHEYPNERAARNLTLVAKTLQTLANFTRFQGKEAFMEFLNDFLEQEAPNMKAFLRTISSRPPEQQSQQQQQQDGSNRNSTTSQGSAGGPEAPRDVTAVTAATAVEPDPEWAPHVDLGKQLATLHGLLVDSLPKLPAAKMQELDPLSDILDELSKRLVNNDIGPSQQINATDNIFRFNDPTCNTATKQNNVESTTNGQLNNNFAHSSPIMNKNGIQFNITPSKSNVEEFKYKGSYVPTVAKSPSLRSATLPRNGYGSSPVNQNVNPDRYSSQYNNQEHCVNLKVVQIGFGSDQYPKGISNGINENLERRFQDRYKPNNFNQQSHYHNSNYNNTERSPSSDSINHNYCANEMQNIMKETATLEELSDLLKYADDSDIVEDKLIMNKKNLSQSKSNNNNNMVNGNKINYTNNGSNVSISGLSNVASSGYQSIATYSQSSSPIENNAHHLPSYENGGQPMSRYSQLNYQKQRDKQYYDNKNEKFYPKSPVQQKIEYDIQKYGIQNFTTADNIQTNTNMNTKIAPLVFTNPVYNMDDNRQSQEKRNNENRNSKRCPCGSSSSSIDEEGLSTDNVETNSEEGSTNFNEDSRNYDQQNRNNTHRKVTRDNCNYEDIYQRSNHSHSPRIRDDESSSNSPSLRKSSKTRMPRTNPMLSYSTNQNQLNLKHFGQRGDTLYENKPHHISTDSGYPMSRSESNVEEVNKEMYRLQISRSQKALYNMENSKNSPEKYTVTDSVIPETNYPLDRTYSGAKMSSGRLNEDLERHQEYYGGRERRESPSQGIFSRESQSSEASERAVVRSEREVTRDKLQRRLSLESARDLTDSSDEIEDTLYSTTGRRRVSKHHRTIEQYEREIERLKCSVELLRGRLGPAEPGQDHTDAKMKAIISRLICVEEELKREQRKMAAALSHKQRVIEAQEHRIAALDEANTRLLSALVHLQQRAPHPTHPTHTTHPTHPTHPTQPAPAHGNTHSTAHSQHAHQELQI